MNTKEPIENNRVSETKIVRYGVWQEMGMDLKYMEEEVISVSAEVMCGTIVAKITYWKHLE